MPKRRVQAILAILLGVALAAPAQAKPRGEAHSRAWMGVTIRDVAANDAEVLGLKKPVRGVVVARIDDEGPAARAGVEPGDVITEFDGRAVRDQEDFLRRLESHAPGDSVRLTVVRESGPRTLKFQVEARPRQHDEIRLGPEMQALRLAHGFGGPQLGVMTVDLDAADLAAYFGVQGGQGVLVSGVAPGSGAAKAGVKAGDVILAVDGAAVHDVAELREQLGEHDAGDEVELKLRRQNRDQSLKVELSEAEYSVRVPRVLRLHDDDYGDLRRELRELRRQLQDLERELHAKPE